ncbi:glycerophosphodiester phosphodiesterase [Nocardioides sp. Kera G14]|uniref:glycerophosphodiester phosphodiesterase n=1 Tax=Nocardioides sp. Kera G14 TaxID=2884264 RepID=UPI001D11C5D9|nr:glycerophosphodiester phosphodiesterase family protein [Nocardioides sp. Kera G14]UDY22326.1 hypothetical protein LH076_09555 [Nocardioides sp. Kera G14]
MARRRHLALAALAPVLAGFLLIAPVSAPAEAATVHRAAPVSSVAHPIAGERFTLSGGLGRSVSRYALLQRRSGNRWVGVQKKRIPASGRYGFVITQPSTTASWRVIARRTRVRHHTYALRQSAPRTLTRAAQRGSIAGARVMRVGGSLLVEAAFSPGRPGRAVQFQINDGSGWRAARNGRQGPIGRTRYTVASSTQRLLQVRAVTGARNGAPAYTTPSVKVPVVGVRPQIAAHRGFSSYYPENTLPAYSGALGNGTDWLETDFQRTAPDTQAEVDSVATGECPAAVTTAGAQHFIALHDNDFDRTTNVRTVFPPSSYPDLYDAKGNPVVGEFTLCQIKQLDAGSWKNPALFAHTPVPTLEEVLDLLRTSSNTTARIMIEPKLSNVTESTALADAVQAYDVAHASDAGYWPLIDPSGHHDRALFDTFDFADATALTAHTPGIEVGTVADNTADAMHGDETAPAISTAAGATAVLVKDNLVTAARVDRLHAAGLKVYVWTVDSAARWFELAALGIDGVITDNSKGMAAQFRTLGL